MESIRVGNLFRKEWIACGLESEVHGTAVSKDSNLLGSSSQAPKLLACRQLWLFLDSWQALSGRS